MRRKKNTVALYVAWTSIPKWICLLIPTRFMQIKKRNTVVINVISKGSFLLRWKIISSKCMKKSITTLVKNVSLRLHMQLTWGNMLKQFMKISNFNAKNALRLIASANLRRHVRAYHQKMKNHDCKLCSYKASAPVLLKRHVEGVHGKIEKYECSICQLKFAFMSNKVEHERAVHGGKRSFSCDRCSYKSTRKSVINNHIKSVHEKKENIECQLCHFTTSLKSKLCQHFEQVHKTKHTYVTKHIRSIQQNTRNVWQREEKDLMCKDCDMRFSMRSDFVNHINCVHMNIAWQNRPRNKE